LKQAGFETFSAHGPAIDRRSGTQQKEAATMILRKFENSSEKMIPVAMAFIVAGLSLIAAGTSWPRISPPVPHAGTDWNDFSHGVIFGIAIVLEIAGVVLAAKAADAKRRKAL